MAMASPPFQLLPEYPTESPEWFAARAEGVTASDMQLLGRNSLAAFTVVKADKVNPGSSFVDTPYTRWGKEREPFIAAHVEFLFGVEPNRRIAVSEADPRWRATPDGLGERLGEYKTTIKDWPEEVGAIPRHYYDQVQWAQHVTGIHETVFAWEVNLGFTPGPVRMVIVPHDEERVEQLLEIAEDFWTFRHSDQPLGEYDDLLAQWAMVDDEIKEVEARKAALDAMIRERAGGNDLAVKSPFGSISLATPSPRKGFDSTAFKAAHPALYEEFVTTTPATKQTLRVTPKKG